MPENWDGFEKSDDPEELRLRRVDPRHPLDFFYGKDFKGSYVFTLRCITAEEPPRQLPQLGNIDIGLYLWGEGDLELRLCLLDAAQADIFKALCANLMSATERLTHEQQTDVIDIIIRRLLRWQELLKARREKKLTKSQVIGLWGELLVLKEFFLEYLSPVEALSAWRGPFGDEQDFIFGSWLTEVKTQLSSSDREIQISSAEQLDTVSGEIVICYQIIGPGIKDDPLAISLNGLIDDVMHRLTATGSALDLLQSIMVESGYIHRAEYDEEKWVLNERRFYRIDEGFPSIKASDLPDGITDVRYRIRTEVLNEYIMEESQFIELALGKNITEG